MRSLADRHAPTLLTATAVGVPLLAVAGAGLTLGAAIGHRAWLLGPHDAGLALALATLTTVPYLLLVLWIDRHEAEPVPLVGLVLSAGAVMAAFASVAGEPAAVLVTGAAAAWGDGWGAPVLEELFKALPLLALLLLARDQLDGVLDGVVYGALVGLGFAWFENFLYYLHASDRGLIEAAELAWLRGVLSGLGSHATFSAIVGAAVGVLRVHRRGALRALALPAALTVAILAHGLWNAVAPELLANDPDRLHRLAVTGPLAVLTLQGPFLALMAALVGLEWRHQDELIRAFLGREPADVIDPAEIPRLVPARRRVGRELLALQSRGVAGLWQHRRLTDALVRLAFARWHHEQDEVPWRPDEDREVLDLRRRVRSLRARGVTL